VSVQIVRFRTDAAHAAELEESIGRVLAALADAAPAGVSYTAVRAPESSEFLLMLALEEGIANPLPELPEAAALRTLITQRAGGPVPPVAMQVIGEYRAGEAR